MLCQVIHCAGRISATTRPHQLHWSDQEWYNLADCHARLQITYISGQAALSLSIQDSSISYIMAGLIRSYSIVYTLK